MKTVHTKLFLLFALIVYVGFPNATGTKPDQETPSEREQAPGPGSGTLEARPAADTQDSPGRPAADTQDTPGSPEARSTEDKRQVCDFF
jgi:hypothetical protein